MKNIRIWIIFTAFLIASVGGALAVSASDISNAVFNATVQVSNNSTATTNVCVPVAGCNVTALVDGNYIAATADDWTIRSQSGADTYFMPGYGNNPTIVFTDNISKDSQLNYLAYFKNVTGGKTAYFPGSTGMNVGDPANLEISNNGTVELTDVLLDTSQNGIIFNKLGALSCNTTSTGNVTARIMRTYETLTGYTEQDAGGFLTETAENVTATAATSVTDTYLYKDRGAGYFSNLNITFQITVTATGSPLGYGGIAITNTVNDIAGFAATDLYVTGIYNGGAVAQIWLARGAAFAVSDPSIALSSGTKYYCNLVKTSGSDTATCYIYSNYAMTTLVDTLSIAGVGGATTWRYSMGFVNWNSGLAGRVFTGVINDIYINGVSTTYTIMKTVTKAVSAGEHDVSVSVNATSERFELWIDGIISNNVTLGGVSVPNISSSGQIGSSTGTPYIKTMKITKSGVTRGLWSWQYSNTFTDQSGNGNTGTPTFRTTSSDADVSATMLDFGPISQPTAPAWAVGAGPDFLTSNLTTSNSTYPASGNTTIDYPGRTLILAIASAGGTPESWPALIIGTFLLVALSLCVSYFLGEQGATSLMAKSAVNIVGYGVLVALHIFDWWMLLFFLIFEQAIWFAAEERRK